MRTNARIPLAILAAASLLAASCQRQRSAMHPVAPSERAAVEAAIRATIGWAKDKDFQLLFSTIANDEDYLEVQPGKTVTRGFQQFRQCEQFFGSPDFRAVRYEIRDLKIDFSRCGDVAWFYCVLDDINEWRGKPANWENTRWTGVLEKRDGRWVMAQMHFSFAAE